MFALGAVRPNVDATAWIAPGAMVIGDVTIGDESSVWFNCVLRGDTNSIVIGRGCNIQDGTIIHVDPGEMCTVVGDDVTIGHSSIIHGCRLLDRAFVGMGAIVMNGAMIEAGGMLAAGAVLTSGKKIRERELWAGAPAKFLRLLGDDESDGMQRNAEYYVRNAGRFRDILRVCRS